MSSPGIISGRHLEIMWGSFFVSIPLTSALWGIGCLQLYQYYEKYRKADRLWFRLYIFSIWTLDTVHQVLVIHYNYIYFVKGILDRGQLSHLPRTLVLITLFTGPINAMMQAVFLHRVWCLSDRNCILTSFLGATILAQLAINMAGFVKTVNDTALAQLSDTLPLSLAYTSVAMAADTLLAFTLVWLLRRARSGLRSSDSIVNRLVTYVMGTSLVTVLGMAISLIFSLVAIYSCINITANVIVPKLYFNCLLASLNARSKIRRDLIVSVSDMTFNLTGPSRSQGPRDTLEHAPSRVSNHVDRAGTGAQQSVYHDNSGSDAGTSRCDDAV